MPIQMVSKGAAPSKDAKPTPPPKPVPSKDTAGSEFNPRRIAARARQACRRCGEAVPKGVLIERITDPLTGGYVWVHAHCAPGTAPPAQPAPDSGAIEDLREEVESLRATVAELSAATPKRLEVVIGSAPPVKLEGAAHPKLQRVLRLLANRKPVFLPGPSGSGKSYLAKQAADALKLSFRSISCSIGMTESQLLGRSLPRGKHGQFEYVNTPFLAAYEGGGLFLIDEIDAADSSVLLCINSAIANKRIDLPGRDEQPVATMHADFCVVAAANTFGRGADRMYCGRNPLDESTLDRFRAGTTPVEYSRDLERALWTARGADPDLLEAFWVYRDRIESNRLERILSTRFLQDAADLLAAGFTRDELEEAFFTGWREDEVRKVKGAL